MATLSDALTTYRICAKAEGKPPRTVQWIASSVSYFTDFLGDASPEMASITANDLRRFINTLRDSVKFRNHPYNKPQQQKLSDSSINTYARAIRAFFGYLERAGFIDYNPMAKIKMPKTPIKVVPTFSQREVEKLLSMQDKRTYRGFRDYAILLTFIDTAIRLSELAGLKVDDIDFNEGYLKVMGKGAKERYVPIGAKVMKALLKYKVRYRPEPLATESFWLTVDGRPLALP